MTRSFTSMLIGLQYLAALRAGNSAFIQSLQQSPNNSKVASSLSRIKLQSFVVQNISLTITYFLVRGRFHGIAREAALKVMEMSCSYSQFFHTLEFRHGPKAIVSPRACLMFFLSQAGQQAETEVLREMKEWAGSTLLSAINPVLRSQTLLELVVDSSYRRTTWPCSRHRLFPRSDGVFHRRGPKA